MARMNLHAMKFSKVYPLYVQKVERKKRTCNGFAPVT
jgi:hypothetical protein